MLGIPFLLNRVIGPFFTGFMMAAVGAAADPLSVVILFAFAAVFGFMSLPGTDRLLERLFDAMV
jgi:hypothetical protein